MTGTGIPRRTHALDDLAQHDPDAYHALTNIPAAWNTDHSGVAHGKSTHTRTGVRTGGTLEHALAQPRCEDPDCLTPGRIAAGPGHVAERDARLLLFAHQYTATLDQTPDHDIEATWNHIKLSYDELIHRNLTEHAGATYAAASANLVEAHTRYISRAGRREPIWRRTATDWLIRYSTTGPIGDLFTLLGTFERPSPDPYLPLTEQLRAFAQRHLNQPPVLHTTAALDVIPPEHLAELLHAHDTAKAVTLAWRNQITHLLDQIDPWEKAMRAQLHTDTRLTLVADPGRGGRIPPVFDVYRDTPHSNVLCAPYVIGAYLAVRYQRAHVHLPAQTPQAELDIVYTLLNDRADSLAGDQTEFLHIARRLTS